MTYTNVHLRARRRRRRCASATRRWSQRFELMRELALILNRKRVTPRLHRFRPARAADRIRRVGRDDRRHARAAQHRAPPHRGVHAGGQRSGGRAPGSRRASPCIYRIHELPDPKRVLEFEEIAAHFRLLARASARVPVKRFRMTTAARRPQERTDIVLPTSAAHLAAHYQKLVAKIEGKPEERILSYLMLRSLKQARYSDGERGPLRAGRAQLHALHLAHPPLSGPDRAPRAAAHVLDAKAALTKPSCSDIADDCSAPSAAPPKPSANWSSGRRSSS